MAVYQSVAELGGNLRTGLEDTFCLQDGKKADSNGPLILQLAKVARNVPQFPYFPFMDGVTSQAFGLVTYLKGILNA